MEKLTLICPDTKKKLVEENRDGHHYLTTDAGKIYEFIDGFPDLTFPRKPEKERTDAFAQYNGLAPIYDDFMGQTFKTHNEDEVAIRNKFIDKLNINGNSKVLELGCGTGRDSSQIIKRLDKDGELVVTDISPNMLNQCKKKLSGIDVDKTFCLANGCYLPFPDNYFDAVYSFTAIGYFPDIKKCLSEIVRVTKVGGKVVFGDESMPPWLRGTYFSNVLANTNPRVLSELPLKEIPVEARNVNLQWVVGGIFYLIDFEVGEGEPTGNFDYRVEGTIRGGTLRTRYEGRLEGVSKEAKELAYKAAQATGMTMHDWLDALVRDGAKKDLHL